MERLGVSDDGSAAEVVQPNFERAGVGPFLNSDSAIMGDGEVSYVR